MMSAMAEIACAAAEMALASGLGVNLDDVTGERCVPTLWGEDQSRYLLAVTEEYEEFDTILGSSVGWGGAKNAPAYVGYFIREQEIVLPTSTDATTNLPLSKVRKAHEGWLPGLYE